MAIGKQENKGSRKLVIILAGAVVAVSAVVLWRMVARAPDEVVVMPPLIMPQDLPPELPQVVEPVAEPVAPLDTPPAQADEPVPGMKPFPPQASEPAPGREPSAAQTDEPAPGTEPPSAQADEPAPAPQPVSEAALAPEPLPAPVAVISTPPPPPPPVIKPIDPPAPEPPSADALAEGARAFIARMRDEGKGGRLDLFYERAMRYQEAGRLADAQVLYFSAARKGHAPSALAMGTLYDPSLFEQGARLMDEPDAAQAHKWYEMALQGGDPAAQGALDGLKGWLKKEAQAGSREAAALLARWK